MVSNIGFEESSDYYKNTEFFTGRRTVKVLLENLQDVDIWNDALPTKDNLYFEFGTAIDVADELGLKKGEGCSQLNKINHYQLGENLIICRDSDFSYLTFLMRNIIEENSQANNLISDYIFETIVHSKENIIFFKNFVLQNFAHRINSHISTINVKAPWINNFYINFSNIIYSPLIKLIYHDFILHVDLKLNQKGFKDLSLIFAQVKYIQLRNLNDFNNFYESKVWKRILRNLNNFESTIDQIIVKNNKVDEINKILTSLHDFGVNKDDIYHFFRGHDVEYIFELILKKYFDLVYENEINSLCSGLDQVTAAKRRRELENSKKGFDVYQTNRDLKYHLFFKDTFERLHKLYG